MDPQAEQHKTLKYFQNAIIKKIHTSIDDEIMFKFRRNGPDITTGFLLNRWFRGNYIFDDAKSWTISI